MGIVYTDLLNSLQPLCFSFASVSLDLKIGAVRVLLDRMEVGPHILLTSLMKRTVCCRDKILYRAMAFLNVSVK